MKEIKGLTVVSLNTQSLGIGTLGVRKRAEIKRFLASTTPHADIVLIQELHLSIKDCIPKGNKILYKGGTGLWNDATYSPQSQRHQGGTTILLSAKMGAITEEHGVLIPRRMQFAVIRLSQNLRVRIINVYDYTDTATRNQMWTELQTVVLPEADWIIGGDFNMIKRRKTNKEEAFIKG